MAPIAGGTLLVTKDGYAVASDPDRDLVHVVNLAKQTVVSVPLQAGDEPGRVVEGPSGTAYVAARHGGVVLAIDTAQGTAQRISVCSAPRGIVYDPTYSKLYVACRSGVLAEIDPATQAVTARHHLDPDLRDVLISGDNLVVTRFKTAEVLLVSRSGDVIRRAQPSAQSVTGASVTASVAYRAVSLPGQGAAAGQGAVLVGHVDSSNTTLPSGAGAYYGAFCGGSVADLAVSVVNPNDPAGATGMATVSAGVIGAAAGPLDLALSSSGRVAVLATGNSWSPTTTDRPANMWLTSTADLMGGTFGNNCSGTTGNTVPVTTGGRASCGGVRRRWAMGRSVARASHAAARAGRNDLARGRHAFRHRFCDVPHEHRRRHLLHLVPSRSR